MATRRNRIPTTSIAQLSAVICLVLSSPAGLVGQSVSGQPLYERQPFGRVILNAEHGRSELDIFPLDRTTATRPEDADQLLRIRLLAFPEREFDVAWKHIERIRSFEELMLEEANDLVRNGRFDEAYRTLEVLYRRAPQWPGLDQAIEALLLQEAGAAFQAGRLPEARLSLEELKRRSPQREDLDKPLMRVAAAQFDKYVATERYDLARAMLSWPERYLRPAAAKEAVEDWSSRLQALATQHLAIARQSIDRGDDGAALEAAEAALAIWPASDGAAELAVSIARRRPRLLVGVRRLAPLAAPVVDHDWSARRTARLRSRCLVELSGLNADGGHYASPVAEVTFDEDRRGISVEVHRVEGQANRLTGSDVVRALTQLSRPDSTSYSPVWVDLSPSVSVAEVYATRIRWEQPALRVIPLLQIPLLAPEDTVIAATRPYDIREHSTEVVRWVANQAYALGHNGGPVEIVERRYVRSQDLLAAIRRAQIDIVDRLTPVEAKQLQSATDVRVERYAVPSLHLLVPNPRRPLTRQRIFRRALIYGIDRQTILDQVLLGGEPSEGCRVISGPFPSGVAETDPFAYAYNSEIRPREYDPRLATLLIASAARNGEEDRQVSAPGEPGGAPTGERAAGDPRPSGGGGSSSVRLVIVHADDPVARAVSGAICHYLRALRIDCRSRSLPPGTSAPADDDWDLWYTDVVVVEPFLDVDRLFGPYGLSGQGSPYIDSECRRLVRVTSWSEAREVLHDIHRLCHEQLPVIPLWQLVDYYGYQSYVSGLAPIRLLLYQDVEQWKTDPEAAVARRYVP
jgi:ABC-type transport system substrate-binding protein